MAVVRHLRWRDPNLPGDDELSRSNGWRVLVVL